MRGFVKPGIVQRARSGRWRWACVCESAAGSAPSIGRGQGRSATHRVVELARTAPLAEAAPRVDGGAEVALGVMSEVRASTEGARRRQRRCPLQLQCTQYVCVRNTVRSVWVAEWYPVISRVQRTGYARRSIGGWDGRYEAEAAAASVRDVL